MTPKHFKLAALVAAAMAASGCGLFKKGGPTTPVVGERISVLAGETDVQVDPATAALPMALPAPVANADWAQSGGNAAKSMGHVALTGSLNQLWSASIGQGTSLSARLAAAPIVADGKVFTIDTMSTVRAFDAATGGEVWQSRFGVERGNEASLFGGGLAFTGGRVYATNGLGFVTALDAGNGGQVWQVRPGGPLRGAPTIAGDALYVMSQDNQIFSLKLSDGSTTWNAAAALEIAGVFGVASPAYAQGTVVAGFSSGELNAYRYENARLVWQDALARTSIRTSVSSLSDIDADPVIDNGQVIAIGQGGRMVALELITGQRIWELNLAGISTPWVAGDWVFVVTDDAKLMAIARASGKVRWISQLQQYRKPKSKSGPISYVGPVLAGGRLIVANNQGAIVFADPTTGAVQGQTSIKTGISLPPVVANDMMYVLDDNGRLHAFK
ncbi:PQQ-binding-like beta-propeller repeat protein [Sphingomonas sabuli]|uniref:PQQ-binding-like beta-propeller repeat protein n=1 Tax=Sphingomonas sabuli TaxID=2764186 RepID=A0A7G9L1L1_9SPHN|nr:PQQ-binding-like beta-propeller repeat protein [Sphingomonas sabuli]QNM82510.1 PQQ-binding-like beta-propeller repeat protein [Sphingomonas sabuli]